MPALYVIQQGAKLHLHNRRLQVEKDAQILMDVPLNQISEVIIFGNIGITTPLIGALLSQGVEVIFLKSDGEYRGRLTGGLTPHIPIRRTQYRLLEDPEFCLKTAIGIVDAKLTHYRTLLLRHARNKNIPAAAECAQHILTIMENLKTAKNLPSLLGLEGRASRLYFQGLKLFFDPAWGFEKRMRRPPPDAINLLLSLGYTLLTNLSSSAVQGVGLDPYGGFLHQEAYNRPSLGLDLMEEFRAVVDSIVISLVNKKQITLQNFRTGDAHRPIIIDDAGMRTFLQAFEDRMETRYTHPQRGLQLSLRHCLFEQAQQIVNRIISNSPGFNGMGFR